MHIKNYLLFIFLWIFSAIKSQCPPNEVDVYFMINVSNWAYEVSFELLDDNNNILFNGQMAGSSDWEIRTACIPDNQCVELKVYDSFGDGINQANDFYYLVLDGDTIINEQAYNFGYDETYSFNCPQGSTCFDPLTAQDGIWYEGMFDDSWYEFTPTQTGMYEITTCDSNSCNTQIWMFENCNGNPYTEDESGSFIFNDDAADCSPQSTAFTALEGGITYLIRIGDFQNACTGSIFWTITYQGPVIGCTDPSACNYQPLATVSDTCFYPGDPSCPTGPDLIVDQQYLLNTISLSSVFMDPNSSYDLCQVQEGCVRGMGERTIIRFATKIANIGQEDYFIGTPGANPSQFDFNNCHGHTHYKGYAEYLLFDMDGHEIPVGFKAGFCVMDIDCSMGGTGGYNCGNMGISHGCADIYGAGTTCNWIDITDVDTGDYTFVVRTNWDYSPDALGRFETNHLNNWAQVCIQISYNLAGEKVFSINPNCPTFTDCNGIPYGSSQYDCTGTCGGTTQTGDLNLDNQQDLGDAQIYVNEILSNNITPSNCTDLNGDGVVTVYDACLIQDCWYGEFDSTHTHGADSLLNHCQFPNGFINIGDTVWLSILAYDLNAKTIDIGIRNPYNTVLAYEFDMSGIQILNVDNLIDPIDFPISPTNSLGGYKIVGISYQDSTINKNFSYIPLARINYFTLTDSIVCIDDIIDIVSGTYENVVTVIENGCINLGSNAILSMDQIGVYNNVSGQYEVCNNELPIMLSANNPGGVFSGAGVSGSLFNPYLAGLGLHEISYTMPNNDAVSIWVHVINSDTITFSEDTVQLTINSPLFTIGASPMGGNYAGIGIENNQFNPQLAGVGLHEITYTFVLPNGCIDSKKMYIYVAAEVAIIDIYNNLNLQINPNPFNNFTTLHFTNDKKINYSMNIYDAVGNLVRQYENVNQSVLVIEKGNLVPGVYTFILSGEYLSTGKFLIY